MTFQNVVNTKLTKYYPGDITRENPVDILPYFAEDENCKAGGFVFAGTNAEEQVIGIKPTATEVVGVAKRTPYQANMTGGVSNIYNEGTELTIIKKGYVAVQINSSANLHDNIFVDPITGVINASSSTSLSATAGKLTFASVKTTIDDWKAVTTGDLSLKIDGTAKNLSSLDFSSASTMANVATVIDTALGNDATCAYNATTGLTITSATTGSTSSVEFVSSTALGTLLGTGVSVAGTNAMISTGFKANESGSAGQIIEIYNI